jgi:hypothetical protein
MKAVDKNFATKKKIIDEAIKQGKDPRVAVKEREQTHK